MTNLTSSPSPHPRPLALFAAPRVSHRETQSPWTCPDFGGFCPISVDAVPFGSRTSEGVQPGPKPQTPRRLLSPALPRPAEARAKQGRLLAQRLPFADPNHLRVDTAQAAPKPDREPHFRHPRAAGLHRPTRNRPAIPSHP
jgi:hypothetical protein